MKKCLLCREVVDIVNHDGLCDECVEYISNEEAQRLMDQEDYLKYLDEEGEE